MISIILVILIVALISPKIIRQSVTNQEYINGERKFTTFALSMTTIATLLSASMFKNFIDLTYINGIKFLLPPTIGMLGFCQIMKYLVLPRLDIFFQENTITNAFKKIGGQTFFIIGAIVLFINSNFFASAQIKVILELFTSLAHDLVNVFAIDLNQTISGFAILSLLKISKIISIFILCFTIACYIAKTGTFGVVRTDVWQIIIAFSVLLILMLVLLSGKLGSITMHNIQNNYQNNRVLGITLNTENYLYMLNLFLISCIPIFNSGFASRIFLATNLSKMQKACDWLTIAITAMNISVLIIVLMIPSNINQPASTYIFNELIVSLPLGIMFKMLMCILVLMLAVTTGDTLIHQNVIILHDLMPAKFKGKNFFIVMSFFISSLVCVSALFVDNSWQLIQFSIGLTMPTIAPIILAYVLWQITFSKPIEQLIIFIAMFIGFLVQFKFKQYNILPSFNSGLFGMLANFLIISSLAIFKLGGENYETVKS